MDPVRPEQFVYDGQEGQTRRETVHSPLPSGGVSTVRVYRAVNVATDPRLKAAALDGSLNRDADGAEVAVPFVYHDPKEFHFVLVVPQTTAHRMLFARAALLQRLAEDMRHRVPPYVARADAVVGPAGLAAYIAVTDRHASAQLRGKLEELEARSAKLTSREQDLKERERRMKSRAEAITSKEDDLRLTTERLDVARREIDVRERELEARLEKLQERERALHNSSAPEAVLSEIELSDVALAGEDTTSGVVLNEGSDDLVDSVRLVDDDGAKPAADEVGDEELHDAQLVEAEPPQEAIETGVRQAPSFPIDEIEAPSAEVVLDAELVSREVDLVEDFDDLEELDGEFVDDADVEALDDSIDDVRSGKRISEAAPAIAKPLADATVPPASFFDDPQLQMVAMERDGVWLFARTDEQHEQVFRGEVEFLIQYMSVDEVPVVLLTLVEWSEPRPYVRRAALDAREESSLSLLRSLNETMAAKVVIFNAADRYERSIDVSSTDRRPNLEAILSRASRAEGAGDGATALERALAAPPPVRLRGHPFGPDVAPAESASAAIDQVATLTKWATPAKLDLALLGLSIPRARIDGCFETIVGAAMRFGIALPEALLARAVSLGIANEPGELVVELCNTFRELATSKDRGGLSTDALARNWERLLAAADRLELSVDAKTHQQASQDRERAGGEPSASVDLNPESLADMGVADVQRLLDHPEMRRHAAAELIGREDGEHLTQVSKAIRKMPRGEVLELMPQMVHVGEAAADALIDALGARKTFVRQAAALGLGELKLRRAISPLVQLLQTEPTEVWWEVGRVISVFGGAAIRPLTRAMKDPKGGEERFAYTLGHLLCTDAADDVKSLAEDANTNVKRIAESALTLRELAEEHRGLSDGSGSESSDDTIHSFSRRFYRVLHGDGQAG